MTMLRVRISEGDAPEVDYQWDSQWKPGEGVADWRLAVATEEPRNVGGLSSKATLHTAIVLCLFTDKRLPDDHPLRYLLQGADPRGWWGDAIDVRRDLHEQELGSWLFVFERSILTEDIRRWVEVVAIDALMPLVNQGLCARIDAQATAQFAINRCDLAVQLYGRNGQRVYDAIFENVWQQTATSPKPLQFPQLR